MFSRKKNKLHDIFQKMADKIDEDPIAQQKIEEESSITYYSALIDWFYSANKLAFVLRHLEILPSAPKSEHTQKTKEQLENMEQELVNNLTISLNRIVRMKGESFNDSEVLLSECKRVFFNE